jgi:8-oxo-dGTP diphosphatase
MVDLRQQASERDPRRPIPAVIAVVVRGGEVILVRRANPPDVGLWGFPGGKIELGERLDQTAVRELYEETGVVARAVEVFTAVDAVELASNASVAHHYVLVAVLCQWISGDPIAADDALEARWFDLNSLLAAETVKSFAVDTVAAKGLLLAQNYAAARQG